ncbi:hypothetical protein FOL47_002438, partial [Perkinsus chesapeaki]
MPSPIEDAIRQLQAQVERLSREVSMKQDAVVGKDEQGNPMDVRMCITLLENKIKGIEGGVMTLHDVIREHGERYEQLNQKIDTFGAMMKDMHSVLTNVPKASISESPMSTVRKLHTPAHTTRITDHIEV